MCHIFSDNCSTWISNTGENTLYPFPSLSLNLNSLFFISETVTPASYYFLSAGRTRIHFIKFILHFKSDVIPNRDSRKCSAYINTVNKL